MKNEAYHRWAEINFEDKEKPLRSVAIKRIPFKEAYIPGQFVTVRYYPVNRRLSAFARYITYHHIYELIRAGCEVKIIEHPEDKDITVKMLKRLLKQSIDHYQISKEKIVEAIRSGKLSLPNGLIIEEEK